MKLENEQIVPAMYSIDGTRKRTGFSRTRIYMDIKAGLLDARKVGKRTLITGPSIDARLASLPKA
jgi:hypothetical protein